MKIENILPAVKIIKNDNGKKVSFNISSGDKIRIVDNMDQEFVGLFMFVDYGEVMEMDEDNLIVMQLEDETIETINFTDIVDIEVLVSEIV